MGGRGASSSRIAGLKVNLEYALMKSHEYGNVRYGGTRATRERFEMWNDEVKRLQKLLMKEEEKQATRKKSDSGYNYAGFGDRIKDLENSLISARSTNKINSVAIGAKRLIENINKELENPEGNTVRLKAYKRRAQRLIESAKDKY